MIFYQFWGNRYYSCNTAKVLHKRTIVSLSSQGFYCYQRFYVSLCQGLLVERLRLLYWWLLCKTCHSLPNIYFCESLLLGIRRCLPVCQYCLWSIGCFCSGDEIVPLLIEVSVLRLHFCGYHSKVPVYVCYGLKLRLFSHQLVAPYSKSVLTFLRSNQRCFYYLIFLYLSWTVSIQDCV